MSNDDDPSPRLLPTGGRRAPCVTSPPPSGLASGSRTGPGRALGGGADRGGLGHGGGGRTAVELAEEPLARHAGVGALARATDVELAAIPGVGAAKAARLAAAFELGRRSRGRLAGRAMDDPLAAGRRGPAPASTWAASSARSCGC